MCDGEVQKGRTIRGEGSSNRKETEKGKKEAVFLLPFRDPAA